MKKILLLVMILSLLACDRGNMEDAVRKGLKDPDSAKFGECIIYETRGCISYNAKNSYGGYVGFKIATLKKSPSGFWLTDNLHEISTCYGYELKKLYIADVAKDKMEKDVLDRLKKRGDIPQTTKDWTDIFISKPQACYDMVADLMVFAWDKEYETEQSKKTALEKKIADGLTAIDKGICKN